MKFSVHALQSGINQLPLTEDTADSPRVKQLVRTC